MFNCQSSIFHKVFFIDYFYFYYKIPIVIITHPTQMKNGWHHSRTSLDWVFLSQPVISRAFSPSAFEKHHFETKSENIDFFGALRKNPISSKRFIESKCLSDL